VVDLSAPGGRTRKKLPGLLCFIDGAAKKVQKLNNIDETNLKQEEIECILLEILHMLRIRRKLKKRIDVMVSSA
jgi:hypothetical protein